MAASELSCWRYSERKLVYCRNSASVLSEVDQPTVAASAGSNLSMSYSKWQTKYPHIASCIPDVTGLVVLLREDPAKELEARFGVVNKKGRFVTGSTRDDIEALLEMMQSSQHVTGGEEWVEHQDFFFDAPKGGQYRTRVQYDASGMRLKSETILKETAGAHCVRVCNAQREHAGVDVRVALKTEKPVPDPPSCVETVYVRIKQCRQFVTTCNTWAFDFSMTWSGKTKTQAEQAQRSQDPVFEVECELIDAEKALALHSNDRIAASLLLKVHDLLRDTNRVFVSTSDYDSREQDLLQHSEQKRVSGSRGGLLAPVPKRPKEHKDAGPVQSAQPVRPTDLVSSPEQQLGVAAPAARDVVAAAAMGAKVQQQPSIRKDAADSGQKKMPESPKKAARATEETRAPPPAPRSDDTAAGMAENGVAAGAEDATPEDKQQPSSSGGKKKASDSNLLLAKPRRKLAKKSVQAMEPTQAPSPAQRSDGVPTPAGAVSTSGAAGGEATVSQQPSACESIVDSD